MPMSIFFISFNLLSYQFYTNLQTPPSVVPPISWVLLVLFCLSQVAGTQVCSLWLVEVHESKSPLNSSFQFSGRQEETQWVKLQGNLLSCLCCWLGSFASVLTFFSWPWQLAHTSAIVFEPKTFWGCLSWSLCFLCLAPSARHAPDTLWHSFAGLAFLWVVQK